MDFDDRCNCIFVKDEIDTRRGMRYSSGECVAIRDVVIDLDDCEYLVIAVNPMRNAVVLHNGKTVSVDDLKLARKHIYKED